MKYWLLFFALFSQAAAQVFAGDVVVPDLYAPTEFALPPERRIEGIYQGAVSEMAAELAHVKALKIDIPLAVRDFPFMKDWSPERIYRWFEKMAGLVSIEQTKQEVVNTRIETTGKLRKVYRPPGYGRAVIVQFEVDGKSYAFEVKMSGVGPGQVPSQRAHGNGLGTLGEVTREDFFENAERAAISHFVTNAKDRAKVATLGGTVAGYGFLYAGYDVRHSDGSTSPAGIYIRQAHKRLSYSDDVRAAWLPLEMKQTILEQISSYGFYTGWESNIQGLIKNGKVYVFDFGHWIGWQGEVKEANVWANVNHAINFNLWGWHSDNGPRRDQDQWRTSKLDNVWNWSHETAKSVMGPDGQKNFIAHYRNMVEPELRKLKVGIAASKVNLCKDILRSWR
jgi:hypothetical protein